MSAQMELDFTASPGLCPYGQDVPSIGRVICRKEGREVYTDCTKSICGEQPRCAWKEPDNSPAAVARRLAWLREHKEDA